MTGTGGANGDGAVFSIPIAGGTPTVLASFDGTDGTNPYGSLTLVGSTLYGMTENGGTNNAGTIFSVPVTGGTPTTLQNFGFGGASGGHPYGGFVLSPDGSTLYGEAQDGGANGYGVVFSIPVAGGTPTTLLSFPSPTGLSSTNGANPYGNLTLSADGSTLYGVTYSGGEFNHGVVFSLPVAGGTDTVLASFSTEDAATNGVTLVGSTLYGMTFTSPTVFSVPVTGGPLTDLGRLFIAGDENPQGSLTPTRRRFDALWGNPTRRPGRRKHF